MRFAAEEDAVEGLAAVAHCKPEVPAAAVVGEHISTESRQDHTSAENSTSRFALFARNPALHDAPVREQHSRAVGASVDRLSLAATCADY